MARKAPPIPIQVVEPFISSNARFKKRLIDFDTSSANLEAQHEVWMQQSMAVVRTNSAFHVRIFGFASKLGDAKFNKTLSQSRMNSVLSFLQKIDPRTLSNVEAWETHGEDLSSGGERDNSPEWRAVEVHIFIGEILLSPVPPNVTPVKPNVTPLPSLHYLVESDSKNGLLQLLAVHSLRMPLGVDSIFSSSKTKNIMKYAATSSPWVVWVLQWDSRGLRCFGTSFNKLSREFKRVLAHWTLPPLLHYTL